MSGLRFPWGRAGSAARRAQLELECLEQRQLLAVKFLELPVPATSISLEGLTSGPDGNLWYTAFNANRVGRVTPAGQVAEFDAGAVSNGGPLGITAGPDGNVWYTLKNAGRIARITPTGQVTEFQEGLTPNSGPEAITTGPDGNLWFTERFTGRVGRITPTGSVTEFALPGGGLSQPVGITAGPDGNVWFVEYGANKVGRLTPAGQLTEFALPSANSGVFAITTGPDGNLWFTERLGNRIGRITLTGQVAEFAVPTPNSHPVWIAPGPDGQVWFTERNGGKLGQIAADGSITEYATPALNTQPYALTLGSQRNLVFTQVGVTANRIGSINDVVDGPRGFVQSMYRKALGRFASRPELDAWAAVLTHASTEVVANIIERSPEARTRLVRSWYVQYLGRVPQGGEEQGWVRQMVVGFAEEQVLSAILGSQEYYNRAPQLLGTRSAPGDDHFIRALYGQLLGRTASEGEVVNFRTNFLPYLGRGGVAFVFLNADEYRAGAVRSYYRNLLGRNPALAEVTAWVAYSVRPDLTRMRVFFEASGEFYVNG